MKKNNYIVWFSEVSKDDIPTVGGKGANLSEITRSGFSVPYGFIITTSAYFDFIKDNGLEEKLKYILSKVDYKDTESINVASKNIKRLIVSREISQNLAADIIRYYRIMSGNSKNAFVAVRSSATAEDLPKSSFAGLQETFLNIQGETNLIEAIRKCWASLFTPRAIFYRHENNFDKANVGIAVVVQKMIESQASGVMFTVDPLTNYSNTMVIEAILGLGELIVQGSITPDHYDIEKESLRITKTQIESQKILLRRIGKTTRSTKVAKALQNKQKISNQQIMAIATLGKKIEQHYRFPQDVEWAVEDGKIYILQTRPITTIKKQITGSGKSEESKILLIGNPASPGIASGPVKIIGNAREVGEVKPGDVLVTAKTNPDYIPAMRKACAIVTDYGGRTSHAAIVARELGIPCVVGTESATKRLRSGTIVTVNGMTGEVFKGGFTPIANITKHRPQTNLKTNTKLYVNLAGPDRAGNIAKMHVDGVGLLRAEFMIAEIGIHPKKLIKDGKHRIFVDKLAEKLKIFCKHFSPRPIVYRLSDLKTNEYRHLKGGVEFEQQEENPMIGYRGAYRLIKDSDMLKLEVDAIRKVREEFSFKNLWVMIPYLRTVPELIQIKNLLGSFGLSQSPSFKLWIMVEIPSNVILIDEFINVGIDGISIGSNDLTMLTLGTDRDNSEFAEVFSENDEAVLRSIEHVIRASRKHNITSSICGQAPSVYPDLVEKLVDFGITSISVNPDAVDLVRETIRKAEKRLKTTKLPILKTSI